MIEPDSYRDSPGRGTGTVPLSGTLGVRLSARLRRVRLSQAGPAVRVKVTDPDSDSEAQPERADSATRTVTPTRSRRGSGLSG
jgi:hypothetical protein